MFRSHSDVRGWLRSRTQGRALKAVSELAISCPPVSHLHAHALRKHSLAGACMKWGCSLRSALASGGTGLNGVALCIPRCPSRWGGSLMTVISLSRRSLKTINILPCGR